MSQTWKNKVQLAAFGGCGEMLCVWETLLWAAAVKSEVTVTAPVAKVLWPRQPQHVSG